MMKCALILSGLLVAVEPDVPKAGPKAPAKPKDALPMNAFPFAGFPVLRPIPNVDPSVRREKELRLPTRLLVRRTDDQISVEIGPDSLKSVKMGVGANMVTGLKHEVLVYRGDKLVLSGYGGLQGTGTTYASIGTLYLQRRIDKVPQPGEKYTVKVRLSVFETDIPAQHMWSPESGKYKVLWERTLQQEVK
jgi:hypothetical protein